MEKRLILAIALSLLILLSWSAFVAKVYHVENKEVTKAPLSITVPSQTQTAISQKQEIPLSSLFKFSQDKYDIVFNESQATIQEVIFKDYQSYRFPLKYGFLCTGQSTLFKKENISENSVSFRYQDKDKEIIKHFIFSKHNYNIELEIETKNLSDASRKINFPLILGVLDFSDNIQSRYKDVTVATKEKILHLSARKNLILQEAQFLSLRDTYFCAILEPVDKNNYTVLINPIASQQTEIILNSPEITLAPQQQIGQKYHIYLGPQDLKLINNIKPNWSAIVYYGTFNFISQILLQLLGFFYGLVHSWGWAIVILSLVIYFVLYPLTLKQMRSMREMQLLQPKIEELRKAYSDNPQKLNKEIMELYREHKVNPLGGCLPFFFQIPIFFALYQALTRSIVLKGSSFLWIKDLSEPDHLFMLPFAFKVPLLGIPINAINILPIIMTIGMFFQQKISATTSSSGSAEQQKMMMVIFPFIFGLIFYNMPAGLVLYWFINSTLTLIYQIRISKVK